MLDFDIIAADFLSNKMVINLHMFFRARNTEFDTKVITPILSHQKVSVDAIQIPNSLNSMRIQYNSAVSRAIKWYSASILEWDTTSVFGIVVAIVVAVCKKQFHKKYFL